jgi:hypothetical protein
VHDGTLDRVLDTVPSNTSSVITAKPAICDHFKTGQRSRGQDMKLFYRAGAGSGKFCFGLP